MTSRLSTSWHLITLFILQTSETGYVQNDPRMCIYVCICTWLSSYKAPALCSVSFFKIIKAMDRSGDKQRYGGADCGKKCRMKRISVLKKSCDKRRELMWEHSQDVVQLTVLTSSITCVCVCVRVKPLLHFLSCLWNGFKVQENFPPSNTHGKKKIGYARVVNGSSNTAGVCT